MRQFKRRKLTAEQVQFHIKNIFKQLVDPDVTSVMWITWRSFVRQAYKFTEDVISGSEVQSMQSSECLSLDLRDYSNILCPFPCPPI